VVTGRTSLDRGKPLSIEESVERLAAFRVSHPTRYIGLLWNDGQFAVKRTVFAAPAATDEDLIDMFRTMRDVAGWTYAIVRFGTDSHVADAWLNER
jgi:hypothetical protein